jgi:hypothetical protein
MVGQSNNNTQMLFSTGVLLSVIYNIPELSDMFIDGVDGFYYLQAYLGRGDFSKNDGTLTNSQYLAQEHPRLVKPGVVEQIESLKQYWVNLGSEAIDLSTKRNCFRREALLLVQNLDAQYCANLT